MTNHSASPAASQAVVSRSDRPVAAAQPFTLAKMPIYLWRLGLGPLVGQVFMLITTTGRRSGLARRAVTEYFFVNGKKYVYADPDAQWYQNTLANPHVTIQTAYGTERVAVRRVTAENELTAVFVTLMTNRPMMAQRIMKQIGVQSVPTDLIANAGRIHLLGFEPTSEPTPPPLEPDLAWVLPAAGAALALILVSRRKQR